MAQWLGVNWEVAVQFQVGEEAPSPVWCVQEMANRCRCFSFFDVSLSLLPLPLLLSLKLIKKYILKNRRHQSTLPRLALREGHVRTERKWCP